MDVLRFAEYLILKNDVNTFAIGFTNIENDLGISLKIIEKKEDINACFDDYTFFIPNNHIFYEYFKDLYIRLNKVMIIGEEFYYDGFSYFNMDLYEDGIVLIIHKDLVDGINQNNNVANISISNDHQSIHFHLLYQLYNNLTGISRTVIDKKSRIR